MLGRGTAWIRTLGLVAALGMALSAPAIPQATTVISNVRIPVDLNPDPAVTDTVFGDNEPTCLDEPILLQGTLHIVVKSTRDAKGVLHVNHTHNPQGVTGLGMISGRVFQGSGVSRFYFFTNETRPFQFSFFNTFHLIGQGSAPSYRAFDKLYMTLDEDGNVIDFFLDQLSITCH